LTHRSAISSPGDPAFARGRGKRAMLGWWGGLAFNLALLGLPAGLVMLVLAMDGVALTHFETTPQALIQARQGVERAAGALVPRDLDRARALDFLVAREVTAGDADAARGLLLSAGAIMPGPDSARLYQRLLVNHTDDDVEAAALRFLEPTVAEGYLRIRGGRPSASGNGAALFLVGDDRELAQTARRWLELGGEDVTALTLSALSVVDFGLDPDSAASLRAGASLLKSARSAGRVSPALAARLSAEMAAITPPALVRINLASAFAAPGALADEGAAVAQAMRVSVSAGPFQRFVRQVGELRAVALATSPAGALYLIAHAQSPADFPRLRLLAEAGRERAAAVAKRTPITAALLDAAPATWRAPPGVVGAVGFIFACLLVLLGATALVLKHAVERTIAEQGLPIRVVTPRVGRTRALPKPQRKKPAAVG
jgi:hypothetical protein